MPLSMAGFFSGRCAVNRPRGPDHQQVIVGRAGGCVTLPTRNDSGFAESESRARPNEGAG